MCVCDGEQLGEEEEGFAVQLRAGEEEDCCALSLRFGRPERLAPLFPLSLAWRPPARALAHRLSSPASLRPVRLAGPLTHLA